MTKTEKAVEFHKKRYSCSTAVLSAFMDDAGIDEKEAFAVSMPMAGGKMVKCGAVLAVEYVLSKKFPDEIAEMKIQEFEKKFCKYERFFNL